MSFHANKLSARLCNPQMAYGMRFPAVDRTIYGLEHAIAGGPAEAEGDT
jgi:hypothetical protein